MEQTKLPPIPMEETLEFLVGLLNTSSPTGDTGAAIDYVAAAMKELPVTCAAMRKGSLRITWVGKTNDSAYPRALTAHVDTLGAMVRKIKENGRLQLTSLGGFDWHAVEGEGCTVVSSEGLTYRGSILPTKASVHIHGKEAVNLERSEENYEVRLDVKTSEKKETQELGIRVGDFVYFDPRVELNNGFIRSRHLDDKAGVAAIYGALLALHQAEMTPRYDVTVLISNYEEVGHGGSSGFPADVEELVAVDMAAAGDGQQSDEFTVGICAKDSGGPYHLGLRRRLEKLAQAHEIPYRTDIYPHYGSDGEAAWRAGLDTKVALIGPGVDASHAYERTHRDSLKASAQLIVAYLMSSSE